MITQQKVIIIDLDGTLCSNKESNQNYLELHPHEEVVSKLREYREKGFYIIIYSSRNMRTYEGNIGLINANTLKDIFQWLDSNSIPYDEVHVGKPWCGFDGFYVDDKTIRPQEFLDLSYDEITELLKN
ncbi:MAG: capsular biosynthesis protein [Candidatus Neomarinimicrobiota bacterium]